MAHESENGNCREVSKCIHILNLMMDNEASEEEESFIRDHLDRCIECLEHYEVEKEIRSLIRKKIAHKKVPQELILEIKNKIAQSA